MARYAYLILLIVVIVLLWRPLGPLGIVLAYLLGAGTIALVRWLGRRRD